MRKLTCILSLVTCLFVAACDLNPKITNLPDSIGEFISARYPAMLADPSSQPEIYNSAASDYGTYAGAEMYGSPGADEYTMYASADDYKMPNQSSVVRRPSSEYGTQVDVSVTAPGVAETDVLVVGSPSDYLAVADRKQTIDDRRQVTEITVASGDTLYSISRKYSVPVNDLAVMNNLSAPFALSVGQKLAVSRQSSVVSGQPAVTPQQTTDDRRQTTVTSEPSKPLPKIAARTSSKFAWPVRGTILSSYGAKPNGLVNDGINIGANLGAAVGAAENGVVAYAGNELKGMGNLIIVQHTDGWMTVYAHLDTMSVRRGASVKVGGKIGTVGQTGKVDRPQLHFEIRKGTKAYNPSEYLKN